MTPKQAIFYGEYIKDGNATRAAIAAGFPEKSAHVAGARMLRNAKVNAAIKAWRERKVYELEITAERVLQELARLAYFDPGKLYDKDGKRIPVHELDDVTRAAVTAIEDEITEGPAFVTTRKQKVRFADKGQNLERLGKHLKLFGESAFSAEVEMGKGAQAADSTIKIQLVRPA